MIFLNKPLMGWTQQCTQLTSPWSRNYENSDNDWR